MNVSAHKTDGCCYSFKYTKSILKLIEDNKKYEYLKNGNCSIKCITCKLFTCKYLREKGIRFKIDDFLISSLLDKKQKLVISSNFFKTEEEIINKLINTKKSKTPYILFYLNNNEFI